jgi:hypothetical protein
MPDERENNFSWDIRRSETYLAGGIDLSLS